MFVRRLECFKEMLLWVRKSSEGAIEELEEVVLVVRDEG